MPISEDEYEYSNKSQESQNMMSKAELRKTHKPIMEKRRRARINQCLNEIKTLILEAMNKDPARHTKLEKADILEMAVKHLQNVQRQQLAMAMASDPSVLRKFKSGFNDCASEIDRYMNQIDNVDKGMKQRVSNHLMKCIGGIEQVAQLNFPGISNLPFLSESSVFNAAANVPTVLVEPSSAGDQNNNPRLQIPQGIHLIPSRLPSGELALLVPNSSKMPYFPTAVTATIQQPQQRPSAFATVVPQAGGSSCSSETLSKPLMSPPLSPRRRSPSPHGFRPVLPYKRNFSSEDHQVPQISSTVVSTSAEPHKFTQPLSEVKTMKFPINRYQDNKEASPTKKPSEALCIITNHGERYKQAQMKEDSANYEENLPAQHGLKRKAESQGLLALAPPLKSLKIEPVMAMDYHQRQEGFSFNPLPLQRREEPSPRMGQEDRPGEAGCTDAMWRPW